MDNSYTRKRKRNEPMAAGLIVGHSKEDFLDGSNTILVLEDKSVLDDDDDEILVNPNLIDNERAKKNNELKKKKSSHTSVTDEIDEWGNPIDKGVLAKYDEELEGHKRDTFRLDSHGGVDLLKEASEIDAKQKNFMSEMNLQSLETEKKVVTTDFYTETEMLSFRKPKKKKSKQGKSAPLPDIEETAEERKRKSIKLAARSGMKLSDDEEYTVERVIKVDVSKLKKQVPQEDEDSDSEFELKEHTHLGNVILEDDMSDMVNMIEKTRKLQQLKRTETVDGAAQSKALLNTFVKQEETNDGSQIIINTTTEYCNNIAVDVKTVPKLEIKVEEEEDEDKMLEDIQMEMNKFSRSNFKDKATEGDGMDSTETDTAETKEHENVLGNEVDATRGIGAMLRIAGQKGYLDNKKKSTVAAVPSAASTSLLSNNVQIDRSRGPVDVYSRRMEQQARGSKSGYRNEAFPEKEGYNPNVKLTYCDEKGRDLDEKDAFRKLSHKFHGKGPGKKQIEKHNAKMMKKELTLKMNSSDTPLNTLSKQKKKQEALQTPYLVLSGGKKDGEGLRKE
uniref:SART-1 family protein n=1 Tax=Rhabditophanes sp. KR3021 TaxID=114890 RepID=A0AC35TKP6_9BILA